MYMICLLFSYLANTYLIFISQEILSHKKICVKKIFVKKFCKHCDLIIVFLCNCLIIKKWHLFITYCNRVHKQVNNNLSHKKICVNKNICKKLCKHCDLIIVFVCNCFIIKNGIYLLIYCNRVHLNISKQQLLRCYINREKLWTGNRNWIIGQD